MDESGEELYRCMECGEMVEKNNKFMHDIKCQTNKNSQDKFVCELCLRSVNLKDKEEHLHYHELEHRDISEIINLSSNISRIS